MARRAVARRAGERATHRSGTGPDSVVVHAVRAGRRSPSGLLAVCGYPLRSPHEEVRLDDLPFEERWLRSEDCCTECADSLGLPDPVPLEVDEPAGKTNWALIAAVVTVVPMLSGLLFRVLIAARH